MTLAARSRTQIHNLSDEDAHEIAMEAYIYAYPLVLMELTRRVFTNVAQPDANGHAPMNRFGHKQSFPDPDFTEVVRPNADTLYSMLWFDVSKEPLMIHVPEAAGRYYLLEFMDMWTDVFASPGTRTTGTGAQTFAIRGPKWMGPIPRGAIEIRSPTEQGWILGRTQTNGKADYDAVHRFQSRLVAKPYSDYGDGTPPRKGEVHADLDMSAPVEQIEKLDAGAFYAIFARTARANPPHGNDYPVLARIARLGLEPGRAFDIGSIEHQASAALNDTAALAREKIRTALSKTVRVVNGWTMTDPPIGTYGTDYLRRAAIAYAGLGANLPEDAAYPSMFAEADGTPFDSGKRYVLHFDKGQTPPARAFWSLTLYNERQFFADNPIDRYAIGDRDNLIFNADGSLDLYIQRESPGAGKDSNWLPTPAAGTFSLSMRIYWPKPDVLDGTWKPPALRRADG
ncbi:MAG TPA: DUF1254 domain-containing protein [Rhizomicrobium sp.]|nr:DUF1254 domain-containing protein [Rhizomicrobium sp.]